MMKQLLLFVLLMFSVVAEAQDLRLRRSRFSTPQSVTNNTQQDRVETEKKRKYGDADLIKMSKESSPKAKKLKRMAWIGGAALVALGGIAFIEADRGDSEDYSSWETYESHYNNWMGIGVICMVGSATWTTGFLIASKNAKKKDYLYSSRIIQKEIEIGDNCTLTPSVDLLRDQAMHTQTVGLGLSLSF